MFYITSGLYIVVISQSTQCRTLEMTIHLFTEGRDGGKVEERKEVRKERWREGREAFGLFVNYFTLFQKLKTSFIVTRPGYHEKVSMNITLLIFAVKLVKLFQALLIKCIFRS